MRRRVTASILAVLLLAGIPAAAQRSGGRFGGSRGFGSSSSSSGSSYRSSSSSSSRPSSYGSGSSYRSSSSSSSSSYSRPSSSSYSSSSSSSSYTYTPPPPQRTRLAYYQPPAPSPELSMVALSGAPSVLPGEEPYIAQPESNRRFHRGAGVWFGAGAAGTVVFGLFAGAAMASARRRRQQLEYDAIARDARPQARARPEPPRPRGAPPPPVPRVSERARPRPAPPVETGPCEVRRVSIAFDWQHRAELQRALAQAAATHDMQSEAGMHAGARAVQSLLRKALPGARYAAFASHHLAPERAETLFSRIADNLGARFETLLVNNKARREELALRARAEEGAGLVVVSVVVGATRWLADLPATLDPAGVASVVQDLVPRSPSELVAFEVIWSPAQDSDRMSSAELEAVYPELLPLASAGALGRLACTYCRAVYAGELGRCPACGARDAAHNAPAADAAPRVQTVPCQYCGKQVWSYETRCEHCGARPMD